MASCVVCGVQIKVGQYRSHPVTRTSWHSACETGQSCDSCYAPAVDDFHGVKRCRNCRAESIEHAGQVGPILRNVGNNLRKLGLIDQTELLTVYLRTRYRLESFSPPGPGMVVHGLTSSVTTNSILNTKQRSNIVMLAGVAKDRFAGTLAHEYGHVHLRNLRLNNLPDDIEEGVAQYFSHSYSSISTLTPRFTFLLREIEQDRDPTYGDGFRSVRQAVDHYGYNDFISRLSRGKIPKRPKNRREIETMSNKDTPLFVVYMVVDTSYSMLGEKLDVANELVPALIDACRNYTTLADMLRVSLISFDSEARTVIPMSRHNEIADKQLTVGGSTEYGKAFSEVSANIDRDIAMLKADGFEKIYRPSVFFITDGNPTDSESSRQVGWNELTDTSRKSHPNVTTFGIGDEVELDYLKTYTSKKGQAFKTKSGAEAAESLRSFIEVLVMSFLASAEAAADGTNTQGAVVDLSKVTDDIDFV